MGKAACPGGQGSFGLVPFSCLIVWCFPRTKMSVSACMCVMIAFCNLNMDRKERIPRPSLTLFSTWTSCRADYAFACDGRLFDLLHNRLACRDNIQTLNLNSTRYACEAHYAPNLRPPVSLHFENRPLLFELFLGHSVTFVFRTFR